MSLKMKENLDGCRTSKKQQSEDGEHASLDLHPNDDYYEDEETPGDKHMEEQVIGDKNLVISLKPLRSLGYTDPGWEHGVPQDERKKKVKCNYCEKIVSGGINRFKQHLARIPGEVAYCKNAPEEVYLKIKENMKWHRTGRRNRRPEGKEMAAFYIPPENDYQHEEEELVNGRSKEKQVTDDKNLITSAGDVIRKRPRGRPPKNGNNVTEPRLKKMKQDSAFAVMPKSPISSSYRQVKVKETGDKKIRKEVISAISKFFYHAAVPFTAANSPYFHKMLELVGQYGPGLKGPSSRMVSGRFLQEEIATIKDYQMEVKASWAITGCTIVADSWKDVQGRTLINFLVSCPRGVYFVSSTDASDIIEDAKNLFKLLDKVVEEVGEENVVQVVTENTASYKAAGKMLEEKRRSLFWTPCAAYCIDRMLEDFMKIKWVKECMEKSRRITKFIYNRAWLLNLMRRDFTEGKELVRAAVTRSATSFATLQSLLDHKSSLKKLFQSNTWMSSRSSKMDGGNEVEKIVLNPNFWKKMQFVRKSVDPIMQVMHKVDSVEGLSMPSIYHDMYRAKLAIKAIHGDDERKYGPFWNVVDNHWNSLFHHPLYVAAYFLNPSYRYRSDFVAHPEVIRGLNECIVRLEPDNGRRISASMQISEFVSAKADFGMELAVSTRTELDPAAWWQQHGINCLELQRIAIRILSQPCSSFGCEHNWSSFDQIHSRRKNHLAQKRLNDLIYVHYNLRLRERQLRRNFDDYISLDSILLERLLDDWIVETEQPPFQEDEEIFYNEMELAEEDEHELNGNEELDAAAKEPVVTTALVKMVEPLGVHPPMDVATDDDDDDDDDDLNFLDDNLSD